MNPSEGGLTSHPTSRSMGKKALNGIRFEVVNVGKFFNKGIRVSEAWRKGHQKSLRWSVKTKRRETQRLQGEEKFCVMSRCESGGGRSLDTPPPHRAQPTSTEKEPKSDTASKPITRRN